MLQEWWDNISQNLLANVLWVALASLVGWLAYRWGARRRADTAAKAEAIKEAIADAKEHRLRDAQRYEEGRVLDGLAHRPDEMRPQEPQPGRDLSQQERELIGQAYAVLRDAPDLINEGKLDEAERQVAAQERAVTALHERLSKDDAAVTRATVAVLLARADIQLGTIAFEGRQYGRAAEIYQRAVAWAQQGNDEETLRLALYQTGVAFAYGRIWRPAKEFFERAREHEGQPSSPSTLNNLAVCLNELGDRRGALDAYDGAIALYRELAEGQPNTFPRGLAVTINNRGTCLFETGHRQEALAAYDEALGLYGQLADTAPQAFGEQPAATWDNRGNVLSDMGRREEALAAYDQALGIRRTLAEDSPNRYCPDVACSLNNRGNLLREMGRSEDALASHDEALEIRRRLAEVEPEAFLQHLATTLNNRAAVLRRMDRNEEALAGYDEALAVRRQLAAAKPRAFEPHLAATLNNRANTLSAMTQHDQALAAYAEALDLYRQLARAEPRGFRHHVALTLNNLGVLLARMERREEALAAYGEALAIRRQLAEAEPRAFRASVGTTLSNCGNVLRDMGRREEALAAYDEALAIYKPLAETEPQAFGQYAMVVLRNRMLLEGGEEAWEAFVKEMQEKLNGELPEDTDAPEDSNTEGTVT
ncbi:MAG: tetratricopeptide repeat protein [Armatimonadetes bacterium]|nr:tetratricopeptide repeat protein [Armatimonadota bacterium]